MYEKMQGKGYELIINSIYVINHLLIICAVSIRNTALNKTKSLPSYSLRLERQRVDKLMNKYLSGGEKCCEGKQGMGN